MNSPQKCVQCGESFEPGKAWGRFCTTACRVRYYRQRKREQKPEHSVETALLVAIRDLQAGDLRAAAGVLRLALEDLESLLPAPKRKPRTKRNATVAKGVAPVQRFEAAVAAGHTQRSIANQIGLSDGSLLSRWRKGRDRLSPEREQRLVDWLDERGL